MQQAFTQHIVMVLWFCADFEVWISSFIYVELLFRFVSSVFVFKSSIFLFILFPEVYLLLFLCIIFQWWVFSVVLMLLGYYFDT